VTSAMAPLKSMGSSPRYGVSSTTGAPLTAYQAAYKWGTGVVRQRNP
jgi:hypothetical protein